MDCDIQDMTDEEVQILLNRKPTKEEREKLKQNLEVFENLSKKISVKDGWQFLKNLRKEARRQKAIKAANKFEEQTRAIENVPEEVPMHAYERQLADSFEIYEE
jgi:hypothetical protein